MKYWLWINGRQQGPFDMQEIQDKLANGLSPLTLFMPSPGPGDWGPLSSLAGIATPAAQPAPQPAPQPVATVQFFGAAQKIEEPNIAQIFTILAAIEFVASPVAGMVFGSKDPKIGFLVFAVGMLNGLFFVALAKVIACLNESAERLREIETLLRNRP